MFCPACGSKAEASARYCSACGKELPSEAGVTAKVGSEHSTETDSRELLGPFFVLGLVSGGIYPLLATRGYVERHVQGRHHLWTWGWGRASLGVLLLMLGTVVSLLWAMELSGPREKWEKAEKQLWSDFNRIRPMLERDLGASVSLWLSRHPVDRDGADYASVNGHRAYLSLGEENLTPSQVSARLRSEEARQLLVESRIGWRWEELADTWTPPDYGWPAVILSALSFSILGGLLAAESAWCRKRVRGHELEQLSGEARAMRQDGWRARSGLDFLLTLAMILPWVGWILGVLIVPVRTVRCLALHEAYERDNDLMRSG